MKIWSQWSLENHQEHNGTTRCNVNTLPKCLSDTIKQDVDFSYYWGANLRAIALLLSCVREKNALQRSTFSKLSLLLAHSKHSRKC